MTTLSIGFLRRPFLVALDPMGVGSTSCSVVFREEDREISFTTPLSLSAGFELGGGVYWIGGREGEGERD